MPRGRPFSVRSNTRLAAEQAMASLLEDLAPEMQSRGYRITQRADMRLRFELERRRGILRRRHRESVLIDVDEDERGTQIVAMGVAPRGVRRLMRHLGD
jgi:hypothetical protein